MAAGDRGQGDTRIAARPPAPAAIPLIAVHRKTEKPLHRQIYDAFRSMILDGRLHAGQRIPSSRALADQLGISRLPVLDAYAQLLAEGYIESRSGCGTFVKTLLPERCERELVPPPVKIDTGDEVSRFSKLLPFNTTPWFPGSGAFSVGQIATDHFPFRVWSDLVARHARNVKPEWLNYSDPLGLLEFREVIAAYLRSSRAVRCDASQIMIVNGSQHALDLTARVLFDPGSAVWIEEPGYQFLRHTLLLSGSQLVPVPVDSEGLDVAAGLKLNRNARVAYVTPSHQYPLGVTMSAARRLQLIDWAHRAAAWIVEDDYDSEYRYESTPVASLQGLDTASRVIYIGTFSKTLFPALRLGYLVLPPALVERFVAVRQANDLSPVHIYQAALTGFISAGYFARHIRRTRKLYAERRNALKQALLKEFGAEVEILGAEAGMHLVITLPRLLPSPSQEPGQDYRISLRAAREGLWLWPLSSAYAGSNPRQGFVLGFGGTRASDMLHHVRRLRKLVAAESGYGPAA